MSLPVTTPISPAFLTETDETLVSGIGYQDGDDLIQWYEGNPRGYEGLA